MKRQVKALLISLVAIVLLVGVLFSLKLFIKPTEETPEPQKGSYTLISENYKTASKIEITNNSGSFIIDRIEDSVFSIPGFEDYPQDAADFVILFSGISRLSSSDMVPSPEDLEPYGLKNPAGKATIYFDSGKNYTVLVGGESPYSETEGRYMKIDGDDNIYVLDKSVADLILAKKTDFISLNITNINFEKLTDVLKRADFSGKNVKAFSLLPEQKTYDGTNYADSFKISLPYDIFIDDDKANTVFSTLLNLFASDIEVLGYTDDDLRKYGLLDPSVVASFTFSEDESIKLTLGNKTEDGDYCLISDKYKVIYRVSEHYAETLATISPVSVMSTSPVLPTIYSVNNMIVDWKGERYNYKIISDPSDKTFLEVKLGNAEINSADFKRFYSTALLYKASDIAEPVAEGAPSLRIEYVYSDKQKGSDILEFYSIGERRYKVVKNKVSAFITKSSEINAITALLDKLIAGERIVLDE
jgi:hypothetical protein